MRIEIGVLEVASRLPLSRDTRARFAKSLRKRKNAAGNTGSDLLSLGRSPDAPFAFAPSNNPTVSVLIVSYNSARDLETALCSVARQTYPYVEVVVVENGQEDTRDLVKKYAPDARFLKADGNIGFAAANNLACHHATGEYFLLLNPDARLDEDCIGEMLQAFQRYPTAAVVAPKTRFWERFIKLRFESESAFQIDCAEIEAQLEYKKYFCRTGQTTKGKLVSARVGRDFYSLEVDLPVDTATFTIDAHGTGSITLYRDRQPKIFFPFDGEKVRITTSLAPEAAADARWLINNAGSDLAKGVPYDVGFGEVDGTGYDTPREVDAFCGCAALIKRTTILKREMFRPQFFAYFEDSELSHWLRARNWKIIYWPRARAYHKHSTASSEGSPVWTVLVARARLLYDFFCDKQKTDAPLNEFLSNKARYAPLPKALADTLTQLDATVRDAPVALSRNLGVYNSYWHAMGGGEVHAVQIASRLAGHEDRIFLMGEEDFDVKKVCGIAGVDPARFRKIVGPVGEDETGVFDIFINSKYASNLKSRAKQSIYLVSFPHKKFNRDAIKSYDLWFNSEFTQSWASKIWGDIDGRVVLPTFSASTGQAKAQPAEKTQTIASVGRFSPSGHCKNQHEIIKAFAAAPGCSGWTLYLIGSLNASVEGDVAYFRSLKDIPVPSDRTVKIMPDASVDALQDVLSQAYIYVHAAGLGKSPDEPNKHEHFGIAVLEACAFGCLPIVYSVGGPAEIVRRTGVGATYDTANGLIAELDRSVSGFPQADGAQISQGAARLREMNETEVLEIARSYG